MAQSTSETYKYVILDIAEIETFVRLCERGRLPIDLLLDKIDEKIEKVINIKFKMARGSDIKEDEEKEVHDLFKRLVQIKDNNPETRQALEHRELNICKEWTEFDKILEKQRDQI